MDIRNFPSSDEFAQFPQQTDVGAPQDPEQDTLNGTDATGRGLTRKVGNFPSYDEFAQFPQQTDVGAPQDPEQDTFNGTVASSRGFIRKVGNSPSSDEFAIFSQQTDVGLPQDTEPEHAIINKMCNVNRSNDEEIKLLNKFLKELHKPDNTNKEQYFTHWEDVPRILTKESRYAFQKQCHVLPLDEAIIQKLSSTNAFLQLFWPFSFQISVMNQKLALFGITGKEYNNNIKTRFFRVLEEFQGIQMPVAENEIVLSFDHPKLVDGMNRSSLLHNSHDFVKKRKQFFSKTQSKAIANNVQAAFELINKTSPELYSSMRQLIACLAFYKSETHSYVGGTIGSALGVIWLDPSAGGDWAVPIYAEQIVHEFIHTSLFYKELVHGTYTSHANLSKAKVVSSIRRQLRDYDKSFHAAYVSAGLITFNSRAGFQKRALNLAKALPSSVKDLVNVNKRKGILTSKGEAMLQTMVDFITLIRID